MKSFSTNIALAALALAGIMLLSTMPVHHDAAASDLPEGETQPLASSEGPSLTAPAINGADVPSWNIGYSWSSSKYTFKAIYENNVNISLRSKSSPDSYSLNHMWSRQEMYFTFTVAGIETHIMNGKKVRVYNCTATGSGMGEGWTMSGSNEAHYIVTVGAGGGGGFRWYNIEDLSLLTERLYYDGGVYLRAGPGMTLCTWQTNEAHTYQWDRFVYTNGSTPIEIHDFPLKVGESHTENVKKVFWDKNRLTRIYKSLLCSAADDTTFHRDMPFWSNYTFTVQSKVSKTVGPLTWDCYYINGADANAPPGATTPQYYRQYFNQTYGAPLEEQGRLWYDKKTNEDGDATLDNVYYCWKEIITGTPTGGASSEVITAKVTPSVAEAGSYVYVTGSVKIGGNPAGADLRAEVYNSAMKADVSANPTTGLYNATINIPLTNVADNTTTSFDVGSHGIEVWDKASSPPATWYHDVATLTVIARQAPTANAGADQNVNTGTLVTFNGAGSTDNDRIASYSWTFTDGTPKTLTGKSPTYTFNTAGVYTVTLTVTDASGLTAADTVQITVAGAANVPPTANAGVDQTGTANFLCTFNGAGSSDGDGTIVSYSWGFTYNSAPQTLTGVSPSFNFQIPGIYTVTLTVTDDDGATDDDTMTVTVNVNPPTANAGIDQTGVANYLCTFNGAGSSDPDGSVVSYSWAFTDGTPKTLSGVSPTYTFTTAGIYTVTLTVTDDDGATDDDTMTVTVNLLSFNRAFTAGWHLMSFPVGTEGGKPVETFLADEMANIRTVMAWDAQNRCWLVWDANYPEWMNTLQMIDEEHGYWVKFAATGDGQLTVQGKAMTATVIQLYAGWNLVPVPDQHSVAANTALGGTGFDLLMKYDAAQTYRINTMLGTELMVPGNAYWVHVPAATTYTVTY